jgi:hypothetical protein
MSRLTQRADELVEPASLNDPGHNEEGGPLDRPIETAMSFVASPEPGFDYSSLNPDVADAARAARDRIKAIKAKIHSARYEIGRDLIDMKRSLGHGNFRRWVVAELSFSLRSAENYMAAASFIADKIAPVALFPPKAIYALASAPPEIAQQVLAEADAGTVLSADEIRQRVNASAARRKPEAKRARDNAKHERAAEAVPPQGDREEDHQATETKRNDKARCVARFLVTMLEWNGVAELLSMLNGTDWHRVIEFLDGPNWVNGQPIWDEIEIPPLWSDAQSEHRNN